MALALLLSRARTPSKSTTTWDAYAGSAGHCRLDVQRRRIRTTVLVTGTLGTLDSIGVVAQHIGDEGK
jgi:hypothetical protein